MKTISIWANRNTKKAIGLIIAIEIIKSLLGIKIGSDFFSKISLASIEIITLSIVLIVVFIRINYEKTFQSNQDLNRRRIRLVSTAIIFFSSFILSILLGNYYKNMGYFYNNQKVSYAGVTIRNDSTENLKRSSLFEKRKELNDYKSQKNQTLNLSERKSDTDSDYVGKRLLYVLLFLLSLILTYFAVVLSCSIACSGYGFWAILAFLAALGIFSGGVYFLMRAFRKTVKPNKMMTHEEKKRERKKFFITWGIVTAIIGLIILLSNVSN